MEEEGIALEVGGGGSGGGGGRQGWRDEGGRMVNSCTQAGKHGRSSTARVGLLAASTLR